jgi:hypothetical protein
MVEECLPEADGVEGCIWIDSKLNTAAEHMQEYEFGYGEQDL